MKINPLLLIGAALLFLKKPATGTVLPAAVTPSPTTTNDTVVTAISEQTLPAAGLQPLVMTAELPQVSSGIPAAASPATVSPYTTAVDTVVTDTPMMVVTPPTVTPVVISETPPPTPVMVAPTETPANVEVPPPSADAPNGWVFGSDVAGTWGGFFPNGSFTDFTISFPVTAKMVLNRVRIEASDFGYWDTKEANAFALVVFLNGQRVNSAYTENLDLTVLAGSVLTFGFEGSGYSDPNRTDRTFTLKLMTSAGEISYTFGKQGIVVAPYDTGSEGFWLDFDDFPMSPPPTDVVMPPPPPTTISDEPVYNPYGDQGDVYNPYITEAVTGWVLGSEVAGTWGGFSSNNSFKDFTISFPVTASMVLNRARIEASDWGYWDTMQENAYALVVFLNGEQVNSAYTENLNLRVPVGSVLTFGFEGSAYSNPDWPERKFTLTLMTSAGELRQTYSKQ